MKKGPLGKHLSAKSAGLILISVGGGILASCFFPPHLTILCLSLLLTIAGFCLLSGAKGGCF